MAPPYSIFIGCNTATTPSNIMTLLSWEVGNEDKKELECDRAIGMK